LIYAFISYYIYAPRIVLALARQIRTICNSGSILIW